MESKLKALKIVNLRDLLTRAQVPIPAKANKPDLIAKIIESPTALSVFEELYGEGNVRPSGANTPRPPAVGEEDVKGQVVAAATPKETDILAPPEPFDWSAGAELSTETTAEHATEPAVHVSAKPTSSKGTAPVSAATPSTSATQKQEKTSQPPVDTDEDLKRRRARAERFGISMETNPSSQVKTSQPSADEDEETKKRRARAERFGIPFVAETAQSQTKKATKPTGPKAGAPAATTRGQNVRTKTPKMTAPPIEDDPEKLKTRAMRFGSVEKTKHVKPAAEAVATVTGQKRAAPAETVDPEEAERRRKRAERFGLPVKT